MTSVERLNFYGKKIPQEDEDSKSPDVPKVCVSPDKLWPEKGCIDLKNISIRYRVDLPLVLRGLTAHIPAGSKVHLQVVLVTS